MRIAVLLAVLLLLAGGAAAAAAAGSGCAVPGCTSCPTAAQCEECNDGEGYRLTPVEGVCVCDPRGGFGPVDDADPSKGCACNQRGFALDAAGRCQDRCALDIPGCTGCETNADGEVVDFSRCGSCLRAGGYTVPPTADGRCACNTEIGYGPADVADPAKGCACNMPRYFVDAKQYCTPVCTLTVPGCTACQAADRANCAECDTAAGYALAPAVVPQGSSATSCACAAERGYGAVETVDAEGFITTSCACNVPGWSVINGVCAKTPTPPTGEGRCQRRFPGCARCSKHDRHCVRCDEGLRVVGDRCVSPDACKRDDRNCARCEKRRPRQCAACKHGYRLSYHGRCIRRSSRH